MAAERQPASHTDIHLQQRKVQFNYQDTPLHWVPNEAFCSQLINELHLLLPAGEFWFCRVYNKALPLIQDEKLREDVRGFIKQEAIHGRSHGGVIEKYLNHNGIETRSYLKLVEWLFNRLLDDKPLGLRLPRWLASHWLRFRLSLIAAIEHFTCVLGKYIIETKAFDEAGADPVMLDLLRWHGAEEVEHRCVAYDLYNHVGNRSAVLRYVMRVINITLVAPILLYLWAKGANHLMRQDPELKQYKPSMWRLWFWRTWSRTARRTALIPSIAWAFNEAFRYLKPGYDPLKEADTQVAQAYLSQSPAALRAAAK